MKKVYITSTGSFLPNDAIGNDDMEQYLGFINDRPSSARLRVLRSNGIKKRYYALDKQQKTTHSNAELAVLAVMNALQHSSLEENNIELLASGTTQGDLLVPGFCSDVHAGLNIGPCEIANFQSVCSSGVMALKYAYSLISNGEKSNAITIGSELSSRLFKASRFNRQNLKHVPYDTEFLRWMLSDGAGAFILQDKPSERGLSLEIEWIDIQSNAHQHPTCMYTGKASNKEDDKLSWLDYESYEDASSSGAMNLKQDIRLLDKVIKTGVSHYFNLIDQGKVKVENIDWLCCHYSSEFFKGPIKELMEKGGGSISDEKWFSNLSTKGNTGAASIYIMLDELYHSGMLRNGQTILCMVPESGRFITSFFQLKVVDRKFTGKNYLTREIKAPELNINESTTSQWLIRQLSKIWIEFESNLLKIPIVKKIHHNTMLLNDYKLLLKDLRQQVIDGSQWISRAASNIDIELFELRSAFIMHTATEHKDYQMLEKNFQNLGGNPEEILNGQKNIGSVALSSFMFQQASIHNPIHLLGSMFIIEGIGKRLAGYWGEMIQNQLNLKNNQVSFFTYHGKADEQHFHNLENALNHPYMNMELAKKIAKTAKITARLYQMQLEELGNY